MTGAFGSIRDSVMHIVGAQERIATAMAGTEPVNVNRDRDPFPGLAELRERARVSGETLAGAASRAQPGATVTTTWQGEAVTLPVWVLLDQAPPMPRSTVRTLPPSLLSRASHHLAWTSGPITKIAATRTGAGCGPGRGADSG